MTYGTIKVDTVTFTNDGVDKSVTLSGLVQNPTFSGNVTVTGTLSGVTVTGTTASFTSGNFTNISGGTHTITSGVFAAGSAASPSITFTGDLNTGIYSPGADQVAISTNGTKRLQVDAGGNVSIDAVTNTGLKPLAIYSQARDCEIRLTTNSGTSNDAYVTLRQSGGNLDLYSTNGAITLNPANTERLRITSAGLVGVGTSSPSFLIHGLKSSAGTVARFEANGTDSNISVKTSGREGIIGADTSQSYLLNTDAFPWTFWTNNIQRMTITSAGLVGIGTSSPSGRLTIANDSALNEIEFTGNDYTNVYSSTTQGFDIGISNGSSTGPLRLLTANTERLRITSAGNVGIGTTSPGQALSVAGNISSSAVGTNYVASSSQGVTTSYLITDTSGGNIQVDGAWPIRFTTNSNERARIDSSGRLLVGTSSARSNFYNSTVDSRFLLESNSVAAGERILANVHNSATANGPILLLAKSRSTSIGGNTVVADSDALGAIDFQGNDGSEFVLGARIQAEVDGTPGANDMPGRLVFSTTADGASSPTERMRITSGGTMLQGNTSDLTGVLGTGLKVKSNDVGSSFSAAALCLQGTGGDFYAIKFADGDMGVLSVTSGSVDYVQIGGSTTTATFFSNGLVQLPNVGTTASAANVFMDSTAGNQLARSTSSLRYKTDIEDLDTDRADAALSLRPVWYRSKATADRKDWSHYGLIAEEVAKIEPRLVNWTYLEDDYITVTNEYGIENKELKPSAKLVPDGVQYDRLPVLLLSVVQRQEKRIKQLEAEIAAVKAQLS